MTENRKLIDMPLVKKCVTSMEKGLLNFDHPRSLSFPNPRD
jgi:hypothetical protein